MVVRIRLSRWGQRNRPFYRMVVAYVRSPRDGRHIEVVGRYNPLYHSRQEAEWKVKRVDLDVTRIKYWLSVGAQPSDTVARLLGTAGIIPLYPRSADPAPSGKTLLPAAAFDSSQANEESGGAKSAVAATQKGDAAEIRYEGSEIDVDDGREKMGESPSGRGKLMTDDEQSRTEEWER